MLAFIATPVASACTEFVLKPTVGRTNDGSLSFPSGHATSTFALAVTCLVLLTGTQLKTSSRMPGGVRVAAAVLALLVASSVSVAMVALGAHYFTDAVGGAALGAAVTLCCALTLDSVQLRAGQPGRPDGAVHKVDSADRRGWSGAEYRCCQRAYQCRSDIWFFELL